MIDHYYIFIMIDTGPHCGRFYYDRTMPDEPWAKQRLVELKKQGKRACYTKNHLVPGSFY
jgi:hypothetical protein